MSRIFYRPDDGWTGDFIPFFWEGEFHLFYLKGYHEKVHQDEPLPWYHIGTKDFVNFTDYGEALGPGGDEDPDRSLLTGSIYHHDGTFHMFFGGRNRLLQEQGGRGQVILHATSKDLMEWKKDPDTLVEADTSRYEKIDWRDAFVYNDPILGGHQMLVTARQKEGPAAQRGCIARLGSSDLQNWRTQDTFWAPGSDYTLECPDLFKMGDRWYLMYSVFTEERLTRYRTGPSLEGPWEPPGDAGASGDDTLDGRYWYAAKTASDGEKRYAFGWLASRRGEVDSGEWEWAGNLVVHELVQRPDGGLGVKPPDTLLEEFRKIYRFSSSPLTGEWTGMGRNQRVDVPLGSGWCNLGSGPEVYRFSMILKWTSPPRTCGVAIRLDDETGAHYQIRLEPLENRLVIASRPRPHESTRVERKVDLSGGEARLTVFIEDSVVVVYVNDEIALSNRLYDHKGRGLALFADHGSVNFTHVEIAERRDGKEDGKS